MPTKRLLLPPILSTKLFVFAEKMSIEAFDRSARYISCVLPSKYAMSYPVKAPPWTLSALDGTAIVVSTTYTGPARAGPVASPRASTNTTDETRAIVFRRMGRLLVGVVTKWLPRGTPPPHALRHC